jgi:hypothetical protein
MKLSKITTDIIRRARNAHVSKREEGKNIKHSSFLKWGLVAFVVIVLIGGLVPTERVTWAQVNTWHVATSGSDLTGDGSEVNPFATIQHGIGVSSNGDTVLVHPGIYTENINFNGKNIVVGSLFTTTGDKDYISQTVIDGNQSASVVVFENGEGPTAVLSGLTITNGAAHGSSWPYQSGGGIRIVDAAPYLNNLRITNNSAISEGGGVYLGQNQSGQDVARLSNCDISNNSADFNGGGIRFSSDNKKIAVVENSTITGNTAPTGGGVHIYHAGTLENCLIANNTASNNAGAVYVDWGSNYKGEPGAFITNCAIVNNSAPTHGGFDYVINGGIVKNSIIYHNSNGNWHGGSYTNCCTSPVPSGYGNIDDDPLFVDVANDDFHLSDNSPAIGAGTPDGAPATDIEGNPRPNPAGSNPDMGAYENPLGVPTGSFSVIQVTPPNATLNVASGATISAIFNQAVDFATVSTRTFTVRGGQTGIYTGAYRSGSVLFSPAQTFKPGEEIAVNLSSGLHAINGAALSPYAWQFQAAVGGGSGLLDDSGQSLGNSRAWGMALGDVDNDGDLDAFVANWGAEANKLWLNDGAGTFSDSGQYLGNAWSLDVAFGDIDIDGDLDAFVTNFNQGNEIWLNDGTGALNDSGQRLGSSAESWGVVLGDIDGDGDLDAFVANSYLNTGQPNEVWLNDGSGTFGDSGQRLGSSDTYAVALGDLDGDGDLDALTGNCCDQANKIWLNDGGGGFSDSDQSLGGSYTHAVALGDLDGDGDLDAFVGDKYQDSKVWLNDGFGAFSDSGQRLDDYYNYDVALGDVDADGDLDAFVANSHWSGGQPNKIWLNNGSGTFSDSGQNLGNQFSYVATLGDVDGDGDLDAFVANWGQANKVWLNQNPPIPIALTIDSLDTVAVGSLTYVPVKLQNTTRADDIRGIQFSLYVTDTMILTPAGNLPIRMGDFFPTDSYTYTVRTDDGWDFILNAPFSPTAAVSGTGVIAEFPFYAQTTGCVSLDFDTHLLVNGAAQPIDHQIIPGWTCIPGNVVGTTYLQSRETGHYTDTLVVLEGPGGTFTTTDASGDFTLIGVPSGVYTAHFTHTLFVHAERTIMVTQMATTTVPKVGLWAGDLDQDGNVQARDWYLCAAASIPVNDSAFDISDDGVTDVRDCILVASNIGRPDMPITNPPQGHLASPVHGGERLTAAQSKEEQLTLIPQGNGDMMLRVVDVSRVVYTVGARLRLPDEATVSDVKLRGGFTDGFLQWHQQGNQLYIIAAPCEDHKITQDTDIALIHTTNSNVGIVEIEAANVVKAPGFSIFLPFVVWNAV